MRLRFALILGLAACGGAQEPNLLNISQSRADGPDEFAILPTKPIVVPQDLDTLPPPTPGGSNLTDPTPQADAIAALGGRSGVATTAGDGALLSYSSRFGRDPNIRATLAAADLEFRRANDGRLLERIFNVNVYFRAYEEQSLDQYRELERLRRAGVRTSAVPPNPAAE